MTPTEILKAIEDKTFVLLNVPHGNYYISEFGKVYSLNHATPREVIPIMTSSGEYCVTLYVPGLQNYKLAELMLLTFNRQKKDGEFPCYRNADPSDCTLKNLYWGDQTEEKKWRSHLIISQTKEVLGSIIQPDSIMQESMVRYYCNRSFLIDSQNFMTQIIRVILSESVCRTDNQKLLKMLSEFSEITSVNLLDVNKVIALTQLDIENATIKQHLEDFSRVLTNNRASYHAL